ncbi:hypothetical protein MVEN_01233200 [Mycena venus]|uniref:Uncharacterized protein n=1 Tax=Mycena venus TaxID=2733690 RepID=A0A8H7CW36_9AGAR|nr:hypothetical protein MVEN_01233200 [Mycena venus]
MTVSPFPSSSRLTENNDGEPNFTHLIDKLDSLAKFYQKQLEWVDSSTRVEVNIVEESDADDELSETEIPSLRAKPLPPTTLRRMHWRRQMRSLEAKLNGKARKDRRKSASRRPIPSTSSRQQVEEAMGSHYILAMFGQIIGARMESCRRVQKLAAFNRFKDKRVIARSPDQPGVENGRERSMEDIVH